MSAPAKAVLHPSTFPSLPCQAPPHLSCLPPFLSDHFEGYVVRKNVKGLKVGGGGGWDDRGTRVPAAFGRIISISHARYTAEPRGCQKYRKGTFAAMATQQIALMCLFYKPIKGRKAKKKKKARTHDWNSAEAGSETHEHKAHHITRTH